MTRIEAIRILRCYLFITDRTFQFSYIIKLGTSKYDYLLNAYQIKLTDSEEQISSMNSHIEMKCLTDDKIEMTIDLSEMNKDATSYLDDKQFFLLLDYFNETDKSFNSFYKRCELNEINPYPKSLNKLNK